MLSEDDLKDLYKYLGDTISAGFKEATKEGTVELQDGSDAEKNLKALRDLQKRLSGVCYYDPGTFQLLLDADGYDSERLLLDPDVENMLLHVNDEDIVAKTIVKWRFERDK